MHSGSSAAQPDIEQWRDRGQLVTLAGRQIFVIVEGEARNGTILLIHGFPTASWDWSKIWTELTGDYRLVALDMLGFGFSEKPPHHRYTIHEQADIVELLVTDLGLERFHVLAHDYGDTVAQELLARQLDGTGAGHWQSLCLLNGGLFPETHHALPVQKLLLGPLGPLINRLASKKSLAKSFHTVFGPDTPPSDADIEAFWSLANHGSKFQSHRLINYIRDRRQHRERWVSALQRATIPIALINGSADPVSGAHMVRRFEELKCRCNYHAELPRIGHYPQVEAPQEIIAHYRAFLGGLECAGD